MNSFKSDEWITEVSLSRLTRWSCFYNCIWDCIKFPMTKKEIRTHIEGGWLRVEPLKSMDQYFTPRRAEHIERIAYLVVNPDITPIHINFGRSDILMLCEDWIIDDGNHRLGAAFYRKDKTIKAIISGNINYATKLLGINYIEN